MKFGLEGEGWMLMRGAGPGNASEVLPCPRGDAVPQPKPTKGKMRIHCLENVDKALQFLKEQRVHLENMGSHDIVDGNHRLVLGLIWTIILRFQVGSQGAQWMETASPGWMGLGNLIR